MLTNNALVEELTPFDDLYPYFKKGVGVCDSQRKVGQEQFFKVYHDGGHFVGTLLVNGQVRSHTKKIKTSLDEEFDKFFLEGLQKNLRRNALFIYIKTELQKSFGEISTLDDYLTEKIKVKFANISKRLKRFVRKAKLNKWTHFVTLTYDDKKCNEFEFRKKLKKCLANFHTRHGWKYMGVFERSPENNRLHFHGLFFIPKNEMVGSLEEIRDYSTVQKKMQITHSNSFFAETFGRNDFDPLFDIDVKKGKAIDYIIKYIAKSGEKILYSRGIPSAFLMKLNYKNIASVFFDFVCKFVLFDDIIDYEKDVLRLKKTYKQCCFLIDRS